MAFAGSGRRQEEVSKISEEEINMSVRQIDDSHYKNTDNLSQKRSRIMEELKYGMMMRGKGWDDKK